VPSRPRRRRDPRAATLANLSRPIDAELAQLIRDRAQEQVRERKLCGKMRPRDQTITLHAQKCKMGAECGCTPVTLTFGAIA
jgi:hypothetical protein